MHPAIRTPYRIDRFRSPRPGRRPAAARPPGLERRRRPLLMALALAMAMAMVALLAAVSPTIASPAAARLDPGPAVDAGPTVPPLFPDDDCITGQTNDLNGQLGLVAPFEEQLLCAQTPPGDQGDLKGFAFPLVACGGGGIDQVWLNFRLADEDDPFFLYVWRDHGGLPADACGLEAYARQHAVQQSGPYFSVYELCDAAIPLAAGERFWIGVIYRFLDNTFGADWYLGRNTAGGFADHAYVNESGATGDWVDLYDLGFGNRWGIFVSIAERCAPVAVVPASWGAVKALVR